MQSCDPALGATRPHPSCRRWNGGVSSSGHVPTGRSSRAGRHVRGQGGVVLISVDDGRALYFDDGTPVTAASAIAPLGDGWLIAQDDSTSAAWWRAGSVAPVRLLPPVEGNDRFSETAGTKRLKPDLEVACPAEVDGEPAVLLLGSGSTARRTRGVLVRADDGQPVAAELGPLYALVARRLGLGDGQLNLEGASRHGGD